MFGHLIGDKLVCSGRQHHATAFFFFGFDVVQNRLGIGQGGGIKGQVFRQEAFQRSATLCHRATSRAPQIRAGDQLHDQFLRNI